MCFFFSSRRRHTICLSDWSSDVCSSDLKSDRSHNHGQKEQVGSRGVFGPEEQSKNLRSCEGSQDDAPGSDSERQAKERSEERRVGKECRSRRWRTHGREKDERGV